MGWVWLVCGVMPVLVGVAAWGAEPTLSVKCDRATGVYGLTEAVTWTVDVVGTGDRAGLTGLVYIVQKDGAQAVIEGTLDLSKGPGTITATRREPGALLVSVYGSEKAKAGKPMALGGAVLGWDQIVFAVPAPTDFDAFWKAKLKELNEVPMGAVVEKVEGVKGAEGLVYEKVTLDNIRGTHVRGQLARPAKGEKFPAMLILQWAGVYGLDKNMVIGPAKMGFLTLNISAHDLPIDESAAFYKEQDAGALKDYVYLGNEDRDKSYFLRMLLGCVRASDYLSSRPDWDGKVMLVTGTSQGGLQSFATAALSTHVTALAVQVPAGCDVYGPKGLPARGISWPYWLSGWGPKGKDMQKVEWTAGYFDGGYFAARVHVPSLVALGLVDDTSRPAGVFAAFNAIKAPKEVVIMPLSGHQGNNGGGAMYEGRLRAWEGALLKGEALPIVETRSK